MRFLEALEVENSLDQTSSSRRMRLLFWWCFGAPLLVYLLAAGAIRAGMFPVMLRGLLGWVLILFPVLYFLFVLSVEVLREVPRILRRSGVANVLAQFQAEENWREKTAERLKAKVGASPSEWSQISRRFEADLESLRMRYRYLSVLSGAVFFLLLTGLDSLGEGPVMPVASDGPLGYASIVVFALLFYLSGTQSVRSLHRFWICAEALTSRE